MNRLNTSRGMIIDKNHCENSDFQKCRFCSKRDKLLMEYESPEKFDYLREDKSKIVRFIKRLKNQEEEFNHNEDENTEIALKPNQTEIKLEPVLGNRYRNLDEEMNQNQIIKLLTSKKCLNFNSPNNMQYSLGENSYFIEKC